MITTGIVRYQGQVFVSEAGVYRVRDDNHSPRWGGQPRYNENLVCPPQENPMFASTNDNSGTQRTKMSLYGWDEYLESLNPGRFEQAVSKTLAMFNGAGWPQMESLLFGCNLVRARESSTPGWAQVLTLNYEAGPPRGMPSYAEDPIAVQAFTCICREGAITGRDPMLYYPVVSRYPIYMPWSWLEPFGAGMVTPAPPVGG